MSADDIVVVGRITSVFGIRGWVKIASFTDPLENLLAYQPWLLNEAGHWRQAAVAETASRNKGFIARMVDCDDRDAASRFTGLDIGVPRRTLPAAGEDEFYWSDLVGCRVETVDGTDLGRIERMLATGANDVMIVKSEERERLVPFTAAAVPSVDLAQRRVVVNWDPEF